MGTGTSDPFQGPGFEPTVQHVYHTLSPVLEYTDIPLDKIE